MYFLGRLFQRNAVALVSVFTVSLSLVAGPASSQVSLSTDASARVLTVLPTGLGAQLAEAEQYFAILAGKEPMKPLKAVSQDLLFVFEELERLDRLAKEVLPADCDPSHP